MFTAVPATACVGIAIVPTPVVVDTGPEVVGACVGMDTVEVLVGRDVVVDIEAHGACTAKVSWAL